ncbi:hypothetical protein CO670_15565 [Rhizobium sp. J15]|uniref:hypothetical protein n=1 Tax=Rhizobium sp. J15 TaxID=2035450 RepID=UPI000BE7ED32|nr:hypothetical protein [Rhizobium sp. J15]PDT15910.1 hypothetical protein CO670_15565 [Rhizobium sp. J15]
MENVNEAIECAGEGGEVVFPAGILEVDGFTNLFNDQIWTLDRNTQLLRSATTAGPILAMTAPKLTIRGGVFDGNRGVNNVQTVGIAGEAQHSLDIRGATIRNVAGWGIAFDDGKLVVDECSFSNVGYSAIIWLCTSRAPDGSVRYGPKITRCEINHAIGYAGEPGICLKGGLNGSNNQFQGAEVSGCRIRMPGTSHYSNVGVELTFGQRSRVINNDVLAARIAYSFGHMAASVMTGNTSSAICDYAHELVDSETNTVSGNASTGIAGSIGMVRISGASRYNRGGGNAASSFPSTVSDVSSYPSLNTF